MMNTRKSSNLFFAALCAALLSCPAAQAGYIDNGDGTVTDNGTGLMWQQPMTTGTCTWEQALVHCENLILNNNGAWTSVTGNTSGAKYSDWRLPTAKELASLVDTTRYDSSINTTYFPGTVASNYYWSSTTDSNEISWAWGVDFYDGTVDAYGKINLDYVRAVRSGQAGSLDNLTLWPVPDTGQTLSYTNTFGEDPDYTINQPSYTKLAAGCAPLPENAPTWIMVRDEVTCLVWENKTDDDSIHDKDNTYTWYDNNSATNGGNAGTPGDGTDTMDFIRTLNTDNYGGFSDWRMPTVKELQSIVDYGLVNLAIINTYFPNTKVSHYWTSTPLASNTNYAWGVYFGQGGVYNSSKSLYHSVRAVRSGQCGSFVDVLISKSGTGAGTVTSADGKIDCGSDCSEAYMVFSEVTLTAASAAGSTFTGWSGGGCPGTGQCVVTIADNVTVTANFNLVPTTTTTQPTTTTTKPTTTTTQPTTTTIQPTTTTTSVAPTTTTTSISGPCPARQVLGADNPKLENLRDFRDSRLAHSALGRRLIDMYYNNAGSINAALHRSPALQAAARKGLEALAPMVGRKEE